MQKRHDLKHDISVVDIIEIMKRVERKLLQKSTQYYVMDVILDKVGELLSNKLTDSDRQETLIKIINLLENLLLRLEPKSLEHNEINFIIEKMTKG